MSTFEPFRAVLLAGAAVVAAAPAVAGGHVQHRDHVLGVSFDLTTAGRLETESQAATHAALAEIARLELILSSWRADSELAGLNAATRFEASADLFRVIAFGEAMRACAPSAFSPRLGWVAQAWRGARVSDAEIARLARAAETAPVRLNHKTRQIDRPDAVRFDVDGYAKGYVIDRALAAARKAAPEAKGFLLNLGGDVGAWGAAPDGSAWRAGLGVTLDNAPPEAVVRLENAALALSAGGARDFTRDGRSFAHFLSPLSGAAGGANRAAAVLAPSAMQSDALATALMNLTPQQGAALVSSVPGAAARVVAQDGIVESPLWRVVAEDAAPIMCQAAPAHPWPAGFRLDISFEIPRIEAANYERPYIAIWISDHNRRLVRTLLILGDQPRWRESNYVFWRRVERLDLTGIQTLARASRAPGRYDLVWDGTDNAGQRVGQGAYTVNIEASREHGAHSFQAVPITLGAAPFEAGGEAQPEIGSARVRYGRAQ